MTGIMRMRSTREWSSATEGERGVSLVELLVAIMLLGIVLTMVSGLYISGMRTVSMTGDVNVNTKTASNGMNEVARVIRAGTANPVEGQALSDPAFVEAKPESVILYAYVNLDSSGEQPVMIRLYVNAQRQLVEQRWASNALVDGYWGFPSLYPATTGYAAPESTRILADTIAPHSGSAPYLFTYYSDLKGHDAIAAFGGNVGSSALSTIVAVKVTMTVQPSLTDNSSPVTLVNIVGIPNLGVLGDIS